MGRCPFSLCSELSSPKNEDKLSEKGFRALNQMMYLVFSGYLFVAQLMCMRKTCAVVQMKNTVRLYIRQQRKNLCNPLLWCNRGSNTAGLLSALSMPFFCQVIQAGAAVQWTSNCRRTVAIGSHWTPHPAQNVLLQDELKG